MVVVLKDVHEIMAYNSAPPMGTVLFPMQCDEGIQMKPSRDPLCHCVINMLEWWSKPRKKDSVSLIPQDPFPLALHITQDLIWSLCFTLYTIKDFIWNFINFSIQIPIFFHNPVKTEGDSYNHKNIVHSIYLKSQFLTSAYRKPPATVLWPF